MSAVASPPKLRLSTVRDCPRRAIFEATDAPERELFDSERRIMFRGKSLGRDYIVMLAATNGWRVWIDSGPTHWLPEELRAADAESADAVAELRVPWALGVGHVDLWVRETRTILEVLSSAHASEQMVRSKLLQAVMYVDNHDGSENAALIVINPSDLSEERTVLVPTSRQFKELLEEGRRRIAEVETWAAEGTLPGRVCSKPSEARSHFCRHGEHCFSGYEPPPLEAILADESLSDAARTFAAIKKERSGLARQERELAARQKEAQALLEAADLPAGVTVQIGTVAVTRTAVRRKDTFDWERCEMAGLFDPELYADFFRAGASYSSFKAEPINGATEDYGDVPF